MLTAACVCARSQAVSRQGSETVSVRLGSLAAPPQAQLDGFKSRALRAEATAQRHLYATEWRTQEENETASASLLMLSDAAEAAGWDSATSRATRALERCGGERPVIVAAEAAQRACLTLQPVVAVEAALALVQMQAAAAQTVTVWLLTSGTQPAGRGATRAGLWGLGRSARAEASLSLVCVDATPLSAWAGVPLLNEPEAVLGSHRIVVPRLVHTPLIAHPTGSSAPQLGPHLITGGTSGLGLVTSRWLAESGAAAVALLLP